MSNKKENVENDEKKITKKDMEPKSNKKRDALLLIEQEIQNIWENEKTFEIEAPEDTSKPKYLLTFPYFF